MEIVAILLVVTIICFFANIFMIKREQKKGVTHTSSGNRVKDKPQLETIKNMEIKKGTRDLFLETLTKIGCQYEIEEGEDGDVLFVYQGEYFTVRASNNSPYIQIFDTHWEHVELYDVNELSRLKKAINESNLRNSVTTIYTVDEAGKTVDVHSKSVILFIPEIPNVEEYLRIELADYFRVHETIRMEMAHQREKDAKER